MNLEEIRQEIAVLVEKYAPIALQEEFIGGETVIPPSGKLIGKELQLMVTRR